MSEITDKDKASFYRIPPIVLEDIALFGEEIEKFKTGEITADRFKPYRVSRGVYAQRGQTHYMVRVKVPGGGLTPHQVRVIADLSEKHGNGVPHVTNRQDFQIHWVEIDSIVPILNELAKVNLTSKGGGGNTLRNITACPYAGICDKEAFDVSSYPIALAEKFLENPKTFNLPRKFKYCFSGCGDEDCALATIQDVGYIAKTKDGKEGFRLYAGGGMGAKSRVAILLEDFIEKDEIHFSSEALLNMFSKYGNRRNKHKARLRFYLDKVGEEEFKRVYKEELALVKKEGTEKLKLRDVPVLHEVGTDIEEVKAEEGYDNWFKTNVEEQKQKDLYFALVRLDIGDITGVQLRSLANICEELGEGTLRNTQTQNIVLRYLTINETKKLYNKLVEIDLNKKGANGVQDILCCPGASTCNLGICLSKDMSTELIESFDKSTLPLDDLKEIDIKISGCPNSCGQHPIGAIGLFGAARQKDGRQAPHYNISLGGIVKEGETRTGEQLGYVPAKNIPSVLNEILEDFIQSKQENKEANKEISFQHYVDIKGKAFVKTLIKEKYGQLPEYETNKDFYLDYGSDEQFSLAGLGAGECGVGVFDMVDTDMDEANKSIKVVRERAKEAPSDEVSEILYKAFASACRSLLITQAIEPTSDSDAIEQFEKTFVATKILDDKFSNLSKQGAKYLSGLLDEKGLNEGADFVEDILAEVKKLYDDMDETLKFKSEDIKNKLSASSSQSQESETGERTASDEFMDLKGVKCPINYVKAKMKLEMMEKGETLLVYLDDGEPIANVPKSLKNDGQELLKMEKLPDNIHYEILVKKVN